MKSKLLFGVGIAAGYVLGSRVRPGSVRQTQNPRRQYLGQQTRSGQGCRRDRGGEGKGPRGLRPARPKPPAAPGRSSVPPSAATDAPKGQHARTSAAKATIRCAAGCRRRHPRAQHASGDRQPRDHGPPPRTSSPDPALNDQHGPGLVRRRRGNPGRSGHQRRPRRTVLAQVLPAMRAHPARGCR